MDKIGDDKLVESSNEFVIWHQNNVPHLNQCFQFCYFCSHSSRNKWLSNYARMWVAKAADFNCIIDFGKTNFPQREYLFEFNFDKCELWMWLPNWMYSIHYIPRYLQKAVVEKLLATHLVQVGRNEPRHKRMQNDLCHFAGRKQGGAWHNGFKIFI